MVDLNKAMITYLLECPTIQNNKIFFNFGKGEVNNNQITTLSNVATLHTPYVDGTVLKQYKFMMMSFKSSSYIPVVKEQGYPNENLAAMAAFQEIIDWLKDKIADREFPDFGEEFPIDDMFLGSDNPVIWDVDEKVSPPIVKYAVSIQVNYLDTTKSSWNTPKVSI